MLRPIANIIVADRFKFLGCNAFSVRRSVENLSATGSITLPRLAVFDNKERTELAVRESINNGDKVVIEAGYLETGVTTLFTGYIKTVNVNDRVILSIEDSMYDLRLKPLVLTKKKVKLKALLEEILKDTAITVSDRTTDLLVDEFQYNGNIAGALAVIKNKLHLTIYISSDNELYAGGEAVEMLSSEERKNATINLTYGINIITNNVEYQTRESKPLKIVCKGKAKNGKEIVATSGMDGGDVQTHYQYEVTQLKSLQEIADSIYSKQSYDGFGGTLTIFGYPLAIPGGTVVYRNENYADQEGSYFIKGVETTFGVGGLRQVLTMGYKLA